jgi:hypoxanthine phosphoribosyltransferase
MIPPPSHLTPLYSNDDINLQLGIIAEQITELSVKSEERTGKLLLCVCLLRGGMFFFTDVLLKLKHSVEPAFCRAWAYDKSKNGCREATIKMEWQGLHVQGREVVLFDNICDSGRTFVAATNWLTQNGALSVKTAALVYRAHAKSLHKPDYSGFVYEGSEWLVGYGLRDSDSKMMNTRKIYKIDGTSM